MEMMELEKLHSFLCEEHLLPQIWEEKISDSARVQRGGGGDEGGVRRMLAGWWRSGRGSMAELQSAGRSPVGA